MDSAVRHRVDAYWDHVLGGPPSRRGPTRVIGREGDWDGALVVQVGASVRVRCLPERRAELELLVRGLPAEGLMDPLFWSRSARATKVIGPARHFYGTGCARVRDPAITVGDRAALAALRSDVTDGEWSEAGLADEPHTVLLLRVDGRISGAAVLHLWDGAPVDVGILVAPGFRGRGMGSRLGRAACAEACRLAGLVVWRSSLDNRPSLRLAQTLGLSAYGGNLAAYLG